MKKAQADYEGFCSKVFHINPKIRFAAIIDKDGKKMGGGYHKNVSSYLSLQEIKMSVFFAKKRWEDRKRLSHRIGNVRYSITEYEKVKQITVPIGKNHILLVSAEINLNHTIFLEKLCSLFDQYFRGFLLRQYVSDKEIKKINQRAIKAVKQDKGHMKQFSEIH